MDWVTGWHLSFIRGVKITISTKWDGTVQTLLQEKQVKMRECQVAMGFLGIWKSKQQQQSSNCKIIIAKVDLHIFYTTFKMLSFLEIDHFQASQDL